MASQILVPVIILGVIGLIIGVALAIASQKLAVKEDERIPQVRAVLPGANCGGCGYPGCDGCAAAIVKGEAPVNACPVGGAAVETNQTGIWYLFSCRYGSAYFCIFNSIKQ